MRFRGKVDILSESWKLLEKVTFMLEKVTFMGETHGVEKKRRVRELERCKEEEVEVWEKRGINVRREREIDR